MGFSWEVMNDRCKEEHKVTASDYLSIAKGLFKESIIDWQVENAKEKMNARIQVWLGINYAGQSNRVVIMHKTPDTAEQVQAVKEKPDGFEIEGYVQKPRQTQNVIDVEGSPTDENKNPGETS